MATSLGLCDMRIVAEKEYFRYAFSVWLVF